MLRSLLFFSLFFLNQSAFAGIYKCNVGNGKTEYQSSPCRNGQDITSKIKTPQTAIATKDKTANKTSDLILTEKKCVGKEMSLYFPSSDTPILTMLHVVADFSGNKLIADSPINGTATFMYTCTPWDSILKDIAAKHNLLIRVENKSIFANKK